MDLEKFLTNGIPQAEAANFFISIKQASIPIEDQARMKIAVREVLAMGGGNPTGTAMGAGMAAPAALPPTAQGQQMQPGTPQALPPTAMGQNKVGAVSKTPQESGESRARANFAAGVEKDRLTSGERWGERAGSLLGTAGGGMLGLGGSLMLPEMTSPWNGIATLVPTALGAYLGHRAGRSMGGGLGHAVDVNRFNKLPPVGAAPMEEEKAAADFLGGKVKAKDVPERMRHAFGVARDLHDFGGGRKLKDAIRPAELAGAFKLKKAAAFKLALEQMGITPELDPATQQYLAMEQEADQQAQMGESSYLRQQLEQMRGQQQQLEQQAAQAQQTADTFMQTQGMHDQELQSYQAQVADATQKSMAAQDQVLQQQQAAAAMRMAYQQLRGTLLQAASTDPPSLTPGMPGADAAQAMMSQQAAPNSAPQPQSGPAGQAPNPGTPNTVAPEGDDTVSQPVQPNEPMFGNAEPTSQAGQKDTPKESKGDDKSPDKEVSVKVSTALKRHVPPTDKMKLNSARAGMEVLSHSRPFVDEGKTATVGDVLMKHTKEFRAGLPYAAGGAVLGAGLGAGANYFMTKDDGGELQRKLDEAEAKGSTTYGDAANLAQLRARKTMSDFAQEHPGAMIGAGALLGAREGFGIGPAVPSTLKKMKRIRDQVAQSAGYAKKINWRELWKGSA